MKRESKGDLKKSMESKKAKKEANGGGIGMWGCNTLSDECENVAVMTQIGCGVAVTWDGLCLAER